MSLRAGGLTGLMNQPSAQVIDGSLKFDDSANQHLERTISASNRRTFTLSVWVKHSSTDSNDRLLGNYTDSTNYSSFYFRDTPDFQISFVERVSDTYYVNAHSRRMARDTGWYHIVWAVDTTQATDTDRVKLYVNGVQETLNESYSSGTLNTNAPTLPSQNYETRILGAYNLKVGARSGTDCWDGLMSQFYLIDGQALGPEYFGFTDPLTNTWRPRKAKKDGPNVGTTWSSVSTISSGGAASGKPLSNGFDGSTGTAFEGDTSGATVTVPVSATIVKGGVKVYAAVTSSQPLVVLLKNGGTTVETINAGASGGQFYSSSTYSGPITSLVISRTSRAPEFNAIGINGIILKDDSTTNLDFGTNGFYLPMDANSPIGEDKSGIVTPNDGTVWSNSLTSSSGFRSSEPKQNAFDGDTSSICSAVGSGTITFASPVTFASNSTIRVFLHGGDHTVTVNGGSDQTISAGSFQTVTYSNSGNATFTMTFHRGGGADTGVRAIEINGVILTDGQIGNSLTPKNFGSSLELDSPLVTGARPILNTTQGGTKAGVGVFGSKENKYYTVTTANGSVYQFDITSGDNPSLEFIRGATYKFDYSDHTSHGVLFSSTNPDSSTTAYTDGTSTASNVISFTVPHNAPDTLYYYCVNHPTAMNGAISVTTDETKADPYASKCVLALPMVGAEGGTAFNDIAYLIKGSGSSKSFTAFTGNNDGGGTTSTRGSVLYGRSFFTTRGATNANAGDYIERTGDSDLSMGTDDYTIEFWFHPYQMDTNDVLIDTRHPTTDWPTDDNGIMIYINANGDTAMVSDGVQISGSGVVGKNQDNHFALTREGTTERLFVNGNLIGTATGRNNDYNRDRLHLGSSAPNGEGSSGYYNDLRVYKGVAKYTSSFKVGSPNPVVLPDTPSGVSGSSKLTKITDGAVTFDGTGDYLDLPTSTDFGLASGDDFTIECYTYAESYTGGSSYSEIIRQGTNNAGSDGIYFNINSSGTVEFRMSGTTKTTSGKVNIGAWNHIAVSRSSGTVHISINGVVENFGSVTNSSTTGDFRIGANFETNSFYVGQLSNVRFIKGTALYTSNFTPPTAPLTNVTNTKLLCCQSTIEPGAAAVAPTMGGVNGGTQWSHYASSNAAFSTTNTIQKAFDGNASTKANTAANTGYSQTGNYNNAIEFVPPYPIPYSSSIKVIGRNTGQTTMGVKIDTGSGYGSEIALSSDNLQTVVSGSGNLVRMQVVTKTYSGENELGGIQIDGVYLTDPVSPNGDAAATNFNPFNTDINTVRGQETGYPTLNPLDMRPSTVLSNGNLTVTGAGAAWYLARSTQFVSTGKYYWEYKWYGGAVTETSGYQMGLKTPTSTLSAAAQQTGSFAFQYTTIYQTAGSNNSVVVSPGSTSANDVVMFAYDADAGLMWFGVNGTWNDNADPATGTNSDWTNLPTTGLAPFAGVYNTTIKIDANFGQKPFKYAPPDGFQPINAANIRPETVIARPDQYVGITTWKGDDQASHVINDLNFNGVPDFVWIKRRDGNAMPHQLYDTVRGETKPLQSSASSGEDTQTSGLIDFVRNGFELGASSAVNGLDGDNSNVPFNYLAWCWKAGGDKGVFNVDDVGYANASDVNMNVGALNSSFYDTSDTWSDDLSSPNGSYGESSVTSAFNGSLTSGFEAGNPSNNYSTIRFQPATPITVNTRIRIYVFDYNGSNVTYQYRVNDGSWSNMPGESSSPYRAWRDLGFTGTLTSFEYRSNTSITYKPTLFAVEIDGVMLVNPGTDLSSLTQYPSIAATGCSVGTRQGFSIIKATGSNSGNTIAHGLGKVPKFVIAKDMDNSRAWYIYHGSLGADYRASFDTTEFTSDSGYFGSGMTDTLVTLKSGGSGGNNYNGADMIYYVWADVPGLQKFGQFTANNSTDGSFVELGFRPSIVWVKAASSAGDMSYASWLIADGERSPINPVNKALFANKSAAEGKRGNGSDNYTGVWLDILSNGFKIRYTGTEVNGVSGQTYIYCAWAEAPAFNLYGGQSNAR